MKTVFNAFEGLDSRIPEWTRQRCQLFVKKMYIDVKECVQEARCMEAPHSENAVDEALQKFSLLKGNRRMQSGVRVSKS